MAVVSTGLSTAALRGEFFNRFAQAKTFYQDLCTRIPSTTRTEQYRWLGTVPQMREWGTGRLAKGLRTESYDVTNGKYEATLEVDRDEIADDQLGQIRVRVNELAGRAATHKDYLLSLLLQHGASAGYLAYDGQIFFSAAHTSGASGTQDNQLTSVAAADDAVPTTAEFKVALATAIAQMMTFLDDQGQPMNLSMDGLQVVVPPALIYPAMEAVNASVIAQTSNVMAGVAEVVPMPWLPKASTTAIWYLLKTDGVVRPFIFQDREPIEFNSLAEGSEEEFKREKYLYGVRGRYALAYGYWQYAIEYTFTT